MNISDFFEEIRKKIISFFTSNSGKIMFALSFFLGLNIISQMPYLNIFFSNSLFTLGVVILFMFYLFRLKLHHTLILAFTCLTLNAILTVLGGSDIVTEKIGNAVYGFFVLAFFQYVSDMRK